jgi:MFS transporter, PPP family, 3-phenylpropionic acid transporter
MRPLKVQFFLSYGILGSLAPLLPVFLKDAKRLNEAQIGVAMSMMGASTLLSPLLMTLLADTRLETRRILALAFASTSLVLMALLLDVAPPVTVGLMALYGISVVAVLPLQDGLFFSTLSADGRSGVAVSAYPAVRVWGTVGFIVPALLLWPLVHFAHDARPAVAVAALYCVICFVTSLKILPPVRSGGPRAGSGRLPTIQAIRVLASPQTRFLCLALIVASGASVTYHYFFPLYLREKLGVRHEWVPIIINLGVVGEVFFTLGYGYLQRWLGVKGIILAGMTCMTARLALLAHFPSLTTALIVQAGHGLEIVALFVAPVILLNRLAGDEFRNSMQGAFSMMMGASRLTGSLIAGWIANTNLLNAFQAATFAGLAALLVVATLFRGPTEDHEGAST